MKKALAMVLTLAMMFSLFAFGGSAAFADGEDAAALVSPDFIDPIKDWAKYDELIAQIKAETNFTARASLMHEAENILMATNCVIPI